MHTSKLMTYVHFVIYCPPEYEEKIKQALWNAGAGKWGNYTCYSFTSEGISTWMPLPGSNPHEGKEGEISNVKEKRIETICLEGVVDDVIIAVKKVHPYETPAIEIYKLENDLKK